VSGDSGRPQALRGPALAVAMAEPIPGDALVLWWLGQSGFVLRTGSWVVVVDPYLSDSLTAKYAGTATPHVRMHENVIEPATLAGVPVTAVLSTHHHTDHLDPDTLRPLFAAWHAAGRVVPLVAPDAWRSLAAERSGLTPEVVVGIDDGVRRDVDGIEVTAIAAAHDRIERDEQGRVKCLGYLIRLGRWTVYHSGDGVRYEGLAERLRKSVVDLALLPINGKVGNMSGIDAAALAKDAGIRLVVPCHYGMFTFNTADPAGEFVPACKRLGQPYRVVGLGERVMLGG
jgi:L-ascorbate metabolism protein UlaG (beta-lactamase superfamily)